MVSVDRWQTAQRYERGYWAEQAARIAEGSQSQLDWYRWRADQLGARLTRLGLMHLVDGRARVVEVGCGPIGVASFFAASERVAVDPLESFYGADPVLAALRDPEVQYRTGKGEQLPCADHAFDLAIIENCIDHVQDIDGVMRELARVLTDDGVLYLTVNCRTPVGFVVHRALSRLRLDPGHPHTFTPPRARALVASYGFEVLDCSVGSYRRALAEDLRAAGTRGRAKAVLGISEFVTSLVARRVRRT